MQITTQSFQVHKRIPLTISRGTVSTSIIFWLQIEQDGIEGWGEACPFSTGSQCQTVDMIAKDLKTIQAVFTRYHPLDRQAINERLQALALCSAARAALDTALHDWLGRSAGKPLWQLLGLDRKRIGLTSATIGIGSPDSAVNRLQCWLQQGPIQAFKMKLGSPEGIAADQAMVSAVKAALSPSIQLSVDANGGWCLSQAITMAQWLHELEISYLEQPLSPEADEELMQLRDRSPLPIVVDESCLDIRDIPRLAQCVDGVNIKLMKCGGLQEALRMVYAAQAHGLKVMFGCYSNTILGNTALAHLSPLADFLDLDSHLNLRDDPFRGAILQHGALIPNDSPGLGVTHHDV